MKLKYIIQSSLLALCSCVRAQESLAEMALNPYSDSTTQLEWAEFGSSEKSDIPPVSQFQRSHLRVAEWMSLYLAGLVTHLEIHNQEVNPLVLLKYQELKAQVDLSRQSKAQIDAIDIDPKIANIVAVPALASWSGGFVESLDIMGEWYLSCFERHMIDTSGSVSDDNAKKFARVFAGNRIPFESEALVDVQMATHFSSYDIFVCNPHAVFEVAKELDDSLRPGVRSILIPEDIGVMNDLYGATGKANSILKARYASQKSLIEKSIVDFKSWLSSLDAPPPAGDISNRDVIALKRESARLGRLIELVEYGTSGKNHALFPKLKAYKTSLDHLASTAKIVDIKDMILAKVPFEEEWLRIRRIMEGTSSDEAKKAAVDALGLPAFFHDLDSLLTYPHGEFRRMAPEGASATIADLYARYGLSVAGNMPIELFEFEYLWVAKPEDGVGEAVGIAADVFVLFPDQMTARLKTLPLAERQRVLNYKGNLLDTPAKFFGVFTEEPDDHPDYVLTRYQAQKADIDFKYSALIQWHQSQPTGQ